ncbi:MAG: hypothetical protein L0Y44_07345 [Phycisphaerales bacterium]|nr:hypothetical protein [Phycisphaerales bacterium]MCI0674618.1 hypothetical protein [Phycisphaerales bacterium]
MTCAFDIRSMKRGVIAAAIGAAMSISGGVRAQFGEAAGIAEAMQSDYFKRDVTVIAQELKLDSTQRVIVDALFEDYTASIDQGIEKMKGRFEEMRDQFQTDDHRRVLRLVMQPFKEWAPEKTKIGEQFLENVKVVLTDEQIELWPAVERRLYRERKLKKGSLSGENLDLFIVIREMHLDEATSARIEPTMTAYSMALDEALKQREGAGNNALQNDMIDSISEQDSKKSMDVLKRHITLQVAVRDVNERYIGEIEAALPEELRASFRQAALSRAFPAVYRETPVARLFDKAKELEGLEAATLSSIAETETLYLNELAQMNRRLQQAVREHDPVEAAARAEDFNKRMSGEAVEPKANPTRELFGERDELGQRYAKQLQSLLTAEQFAQLPGSARWVSSGSEAQRAAVPEMSGAKVKPRDPASKPSSTGTAPEEHPD